MSSTEPRNGWLWALAALLCIGSVLVGTTQQGLWGSDEPRVAAVALEMTDGGSLVVPHLNGEPFVEKPPLYFVVAAWSARGLGPLVGDIPAVRLSSSLWSLLCLLVTFRLGRTLARWRRRRPGNSTTAPGAPALPPDQVGLLAAMLLATTFAFVTNGRMVRVDIALTFFVLATAWCFAEAYLAGRRWMLAGAGLMLAGSFLSKGIVGIALPGMAWLGLFPLWALGQRRAGAERDAMLGPHLVSFLLFVIPAGLWVVALRWSPGGEELWNEWFWGNQLGRASGASSLGHSHPGEPFYYARRLLGHTAPWTPLLVVWLAAVGRALWTRRRLAGDQVFLLIWCTASLAMLTVSDAKRSVYLLPLLPAFALASAQAAAAGLPRWCRVFVRGWMSLALLALLALSVLPGLASLAPQLVEAKFGPAVPAWGLANLAAALGLVLAAVLGFRIKTAPLILRGVLVSALMIVAGLAVLVPVADIDNNESGVFNAFMDQIPPEEWPTLVGHGWGEKVRGLFYVHLRSATPQVPAERIEPILAGRDPEFSSVIVRDAAQLPDPDRVRYVVATEAPGQTVTSMPMIWARSTPP